MIFEFFANTFNIFCCFVPLISGFQNHINTVARKFVVQINEMKAKIFHTGSAIVFVFFFGGGSRHIAPSFKNRMSRAQNYISAAVNLTALLGEIYEFFKGKTFTVVYAAVEDINIGRAFIGGKKQTSCRN